MSPYSSYSSLLTSQKEELRRTKLEWSLKEARIYVWQRIIASLLLHIKPMICGNTPAKAFQIPTGSNIRVCHNHLCVWASTALPIGESAKWRRWGEQLATSGGSSLYQLMSVYWNLQMPCTFLCPYASPFLKRRGKPSVKPKHKQVLNGYWGELWKRNYALWIALEPWLNACLLHASDMCKD